MTAQEPQGRGPRSLRLAFICAGVVMVYLDSTVVGVALPDMQEKMNIGVSDLQWVFDIYVLTFACFLLTAGTLGDALGRGRVFLVGLTGFTAASVACALAPGIEALLVARAVQGVFGAVMITVSLALIRQLYTEERARASAVATWAGVGGVALAAGPIVGGLLVDAYSWQSIFWINLPIGVLALGALAWLLPLGSARPEPRTAVPGRKADWIGQVLFVTGIGVMAYALIEAGRRGWGSALIVGLFVGSVLVLGGWLRWESRTSHPMLPLTLLRHRVVLMTCSVNFLSFFGLYGVIFLLTLFLQQVSGLTPVQTGLRLLALTASITVASLLAPAVAARLGTRPAIVAGSLVAAGGFVGLVGMHAESGFGTYWWPLVLIGTGVSVVGAPATVALLSAVPPEQAGVASGMSQTCRQIGAVFGVALSGTLVQQQLHSGLPDVLAKLPLPDPAREKLADAIEHGQSRGADALPTDVRQSVLRSVGDLMADGLHTAVLVAAVGAVLGAVAAAVLLRRQDSGTTAVPAAVELRPETSS
ncbi:MFS transporter [Streptomyces sp. NPDC051677]|uniref:MFS transporter n=1 Tax=Streptomyces sp. NPDC051677 TaxID=3365669 RepID=UPI0037CF357C